MNTESKMASTPGRLVVVTLTTACLLLALVPGAPLGIWPGTALAGTVALLGAGLTSRRELAPLLRPTWRDVGLGLGCGVLMAGATHVLYPLSVSLVPEVAEQVAALYAILGSSPGLLAGLAIVVLVVCGEELVWRGILYGWLRSRLGRGAAVVVATILYAVPQLGGPSWVLLVAALGCGAVWTLQRAVFGNLVVPVLTHLTWDLLVMVFFPLEVGASR